MSALSRINEKSLRPAVQLESVERDEILSFLARRPCHTVFMASLIRENGVVSDRNRGSFYGVRDIDGKFSGVGLLGHATFIEARTDAAMAALASVADHAPVPTVLMRGERHDINRFWDQRQSSIKPRLICDEQLMVQHRPNSSEAIVNDVRPAAPEDLEALININLELFINESGRNPMKENAQGFRERLARRIDQGRIWIWAKDGDIIFKADIVAETPEAIYLESVYVNPAKRGKGYGRRCLSNLGTTLLQRSRSICLTVKDGDQGTAGFFQKAGYAFHSSYQTIYL
jgi:predicted GNAT family acetyltransferase